MAKVLITGASGNVGTEVLAALKHLNDTTDIYAGVRSVESGNELASNYNVQTVKFDFMDSSTFLPAFRNIDVLFLLRPPQIADVKKYFIPLIDMAKKANINHIVFLSVQGVEHSKIIPHYKIEKLIVESKIAYTFLRPAYFMQNFTTTLRHDIIQNQCIYLPAGRAKFTLIDAKDIGAVAARILREPKNHINKRYALTNNETLSFFDMAEKISLSTGKKIIFRSPGILPFFFTKRKEGMPVMFILVMILLHYLPRFQKTPNTTEWVKIITGKNPNSFEDFVSAHKNLLS